jgi:hypothetical protein
MFDPGPLDDAGNNRRHGEDREGTMLRYLVIWEGNHRTLIYGIIALALWIAAYLVYLKNDIRNYFKRRNAHRWGVDMQTKTVTSGPKSVQ